MSRAIGELSYPLSEPGRKVRVDVDSVVELMFVSSLGGVLVEGGSSVVGNEGTLLSLLCCERKGGGRISPKTLTFVVREMGVNVLNSKAL